MKSYSSILYALVLLWTGNSMSMMSPESLRQAGAAFTKGMLDTIESNSNSIKDGIREAAKEISQDFSKNISHGVFQGTGKGAALAIKDVTQELGTSLRENCGRGSQFSKDVDHTALTLGESGAY